LRAAAALKVITYFSDTEELRVPRILRELKIDVRSRQNAEVSM
jgi:hypothetical protein